MKIRPHQITFRKKRRVHGISREGRLAEGKIITLLDPLQHDHHPTIVWVLSQRFLV